MSGGGQLAESSTCDVRSGVVFILGLIFGTFSILTTKILYQMDAVDSEGVYKQYEKPITTVLVMFLAMLVALPIYWVQQVFFTEPSARDKVEMRVLVKMIIPSTFDMLGTALSQAGLLYTTASMFQLMRCSVIIVTALLKVLLFQERLAKHMWIGIAVNSAAMVMVGAAGFLDTGSGAGSNPRLGIALILASCFTQGVQYVFEEKIMANDNCPPLVVIGMEGFWGTLTTLLIAVPVAWAIPGGDCGSYENVWDSFAMMRSSEPIRWMVVAFFISITGYNTMSIYVTQYLSAIWHAILDNFRPISIWGTDLLIYYFITAQTFGECLTQNSYLQFLGMLLLFLGTATYNGSVPCPAFLDPEGAAERAGLLKEGRAATPALTPAYRQTPTLSKSPFLARAAQEHGDARRRRVAEVAAAQRGNLRKSFG